MQTDNIIKASVGVALGVVLLVTLALPIIAGATETETTFTNEGYFRMTQYDDTSEHSVTWTYENPSVVTVDGEDVTIGYTVPNGQVTLIADTNWILRLYTDANGEPTICAMVAATGGTASATVADSQTVSITLSSGEMSATLGDATRTGTYTDLWLPSNDGTFTMKKYNETAYILGDSELVGYGTSRVTTASGAASSSPGFGISLVGTKDDGITGTVWRGSDILALSNIAVNADAVSSHVGLFALDSITATATLTETVDSETVTTDSTITYNYLLVPYQVTAEKAVHFDSSEIAMLELVPLLLAVALVLGVVAYAVRARLS